MLQQRIIHPSLSCGLTGAEGNLIEDAGEISFYDLLPLADLPQGGVDVWHGRWLWL